MTIVIPKPGLLDKLLRLIGKKRGVMVQSEPMDPSGTQIYFAPKKESALKALLRPSRKDFPTGMADVFSLQYDGDRIAEKETGPRNRLPFPFSGLILQNLPGPARNR
jgi:hypothetical protein